MSANPNDQSLAQDWENREFVQNVQYNLMQIASFLNSFDADVRGRMALLNHKLTRLERQVDFIDASLSGFSKMTAPQ